MSLFQESGGIRGRPVVALTAAGLALAGCFLRIRGAGSLVLFGDEVHSISWAIGQRADWLAPYAPLGAWNRAVMQTVGLDEWLLRAPALLGGCAALALVAFLAVRFLPAFEAVAVTAFTALSPYLVYLSREARTYSLVLLLVIACAALVIAWLAQPRTRRLVAAALCGAAAITLHTAIAPTIAVAGAWALAVSARRRELRARRGDLIAAGACFVLLLAVFVAPDAGSVVGNVRARVGASTASVATLLEAFRFGLGLPAGAGAWLALALAFIGTAHLGRRFPTATALALACLAAQVLALFALQPTMLSVPWILLRYVAHTLPFAALAIAAGAGLALTRVRGPALREVLGTALGLAAAATLFLEHAGQGRYGALEHAGQNLHPILQQATRTEIEAEAAALLPLFYREHLPQLPAGALIEAPLVMTYPLYALYQRAHGRGFSSAALGPGLFQHAGRAHSGISFRRTLDAASLPEGAPEEAAYLVVHKRPWLEILGASERLRVAAAAQHRVDPQTLGHVFGGRELALDRSHALAASRIYEDDVVAVYALRVDELAE